MDEVDELIRQFRGLPRTCRKPRESGIKRFEDIMRRVSASYHIEEPGVEAQIMRNWRTIVGPDKAHRCKPSRIIDGHTLVITTTNTTLRAELQFERSRILKQLQQCCTSASIRTVVIR